VKWLFYSVLILFVFLLGPAWMRFNPSIFKNSDWRTASRESSQLAPNPQTTPAAVIQVYAARAFNWRGQFAVHLWMATKSKEC
jgi:hypothetical protein